MEFEAQTTYDAPLAEVFRVETDEALNRERFEANGDTDIEIDECAPTGDGGFQLRSTRSVTVELPGFAAKVLSPTNTIEHTVTWEPERDGVRRATFEIDVSGAPVKTTGTVVLESIDGDHTRHTVRGDLEVKVPLVGKKIASWARGDAVKQAEQEFEFTRSKVAGAT